MGYLGESVPAPVAVEVVRGGIVESVHRAHIAVASADGELLAAAGDPHVAAFARSSLKPILAQAMVEFGYRPSSHAEAALAASSHSGEAFHIAGVEGMLTSIGLSPADLANTPDWPFDEVERVDWIATGGRKSRIAANCSGKHAAMLATCVANDWPTAGYLDHSHPLPTALGEFVAEATGADPAAVAVDGCGAAIWPVPLVGLARAFAALGQARPNSAGGIIADGMRAEPDYVAGHRREATALMRTFPGLVAKDGADGMYAAALPDGRGVALKISDGGARARPAAIAGTLVELGLDPELLAPIASWEQVLGGGRPAGEIRPTVRLTTLD
ncbi:MAG: asparaginase [Actinobacteria bacterium]|nr:asparaginase [Actinomycetota bacterium]